MFNKQQHHLCVCFGKTCVGWGAMIIIQMGLFPSLNLMHYFKRWTAMRIIRKMMRQNCQDYLKRNYDNFYFMKKYLLATLLIVFANKLNSAIPKQKDDCFIFLIYISGNQGSLSNYNQQPSQPSSTPGNITLAWICIVDLNCDGTIDTIEFGAAFITYDTDSDGSLNDEAEIPGKLEKKF
jgi:hypothetical protein